jgi:uncharacterized DUF497 family protein
MRRVRYEWDDAKSTSNQRKHGVDFLDAIAALEDPNRLDDIDVNFDYGEERTSGSLRDMRHKIGFKEALY